MIRPNELRIGNLVGVLLSPDDTNPPITVRVNSIDEHEGILVDGLDLVFKFSDLWSIPLSEEWLLRLGFEYNGGMGYKSPYNTSYWHFSLANGVVPSIYVKHTVSSDGYVGCEYVHQLQNLFHSLTGQELTITPNGQAPH